MRTRTTIGLSLALAVVSAVSWAKESHAVHHQPAVKDRHARAAAGADLRTRAKRRHPAVARAERPRLAHRAANPALAHRERRHARQPRHLATLPPQDRTVDHLRPIGPRETGDAAWYGPRFLGKRTASGDRLDAVHPTAAHRWLPLHSLVRVTNLRNGRSAIAVVNDRGPFERSVLIDLSPRMARELHMIEAGIVPVAVVPVATSGRPAR